MKLWLQLWLTFYLLVVRADKDNKNWSFKYKFKVLALQYFPFLCNLNLQLKTRLDWEVEKMNDARWSCSVVRSYGSTWSCLHKCKHKVDGERAASSLICVWSLQREAETLQSSSVLSVSTPTCTVSQKQTAGKLWLLHPPRVNSYLFHSLSDDQVFDCSHYYLSKKKTPTRLRSWKGRKWGWIKSLWWRRMQRWVTGNKQEAVRLATRHQER